MSEELFGPLSVISMRGCEDFCAAVDKYLKRWRETNKSFIVPAKATDPKSATCMVMHIWCLMIQTSMYMLTALTLTRGLFLITVLYALNAERSLAVPRPAQAKDAHIHPKHSLPMFGMTTA